MGFQRDLYDQVSITAGGEIDLRAKFDELIYGTGGKIPHGQKILVRNLRRDGSNLVPCVCRDLLTKEGDPSCSYCQGEAYIWDEVWADAYSQYQSSEGGLIRKNTWMPAGQLRVDYKTFYLRYNTSIRYGDKLIEVSLDEEGRVVVPYIRETIYKPETIQEYRSDRGRIEYIGVHCRENSAVRMSYV